MKKRWISISIFLLLSIIIFIVFCAIMAKCGGEPLGMDVWARDLAYSTRGEKYGFSFWFNRIFTELGYTYFIVALVVFGLFYTKLDRRWVCFGLCCLLETILNSVFKSMYQRQRPFLEYQWMHESSTSFPSGHSTSSGAVYSFLVYFFLTSDYKKLVRYVGAGICAFIMVTIPITRIVLGMHYLSDCIAGLMLGFIVSGIFMVISELFRKYDILNESVIRFKKKS